MSIDFLKSLIIKEEHKNHPRESCGYVLDNGRGKPVLHPCANLHPDPEGAFDTHPQEYLKVLDSGNLLGFYHTHPKGPADFSREDHECTQRMNLGHWLYSARDSQLAYDAPRSSRKLEGRRFVLNAQDCVTLLLDYYAQELQLSIPYIEHSLEDLGSLGLNGWQSHMTLWQEVDEPRKHDVLLFNMDHQGPPNHVAIYLGDNSILHQMVHSPSERQFYSSTLKQQTVKILRYKV